MLITVHVSGDGEAWIRSMNLDPSDDSVDEAAWMAAEVHLCFGVSRVMYAAVCCSMLYRAPITQFSHVLPLYVQSSDSYCPMEGDLVEFIGDETNSNIRLVSNTCTHILIIFISFSSAAHK